MESAAELRERGHEHLALGEHGRALEVARALQAHDPAAGLELRALALAAGGRPAEAARALEEGLSRLPDAWRLELLLGNLRAAAGELAEAHRAYERAAAAPGAEPATVDYNRGLLLEAQGEWARAFALLEQTPEPAEAELGARLDALRARVLAAMGLADRAIDLIEERLEESEGIDLSLHCLAELLCERGRAIHAAGHDRERAVEALLVALELDPAYGPASDLLREVEDRRSPAGRLYELVLEVREPVLGEDPPRAGLDGHYRSYRVVAPGPKAAGEYALRTEQAPLARTISCAELGPAPGERAGVVEAGAAVRFSGT